jgi:hypothetical protein
MGLEAMSSDAEGSDAAWVFCGATRDVLEHKMRSELSQTRQ